MYIEPEILERVNYFAGESSVRRNSIGSVIVREWFTPAYF